MTRSRAFLWGAALLAMMGGGGAMVLASGTAEDQAALAEPAVQAPLPPAVTITRLDRSPVRPIVTAYGVAAAHYRHQLVAEVSGRVETLAPELAPGQLLAGGFQVAKIASTPYRRAVADARVTLAEMRVAYQEEKQRAVQARADWRRAGVGKAPTSDLVLRQPYLDLAALKVAAARDALTEAEEQLARTRITVPFDAVVVSRQVTPGAWVSVGTPLAELYSADNLVVTVPVTAQQQALLFAAGRAEDAAPSARVTDDQGRHWRAVLIGRAGEADDRTRQQSLRLRIDVPAEGPGSLLPGGFVTATLVGRERQDLVQVPASAITADNFLWYVDGDDQLVRLPVRPVLRWGDRVALTAETFARLLIVRVVVNPLASFLPGTTVSPQSLQQTVAGEVPANG